jgi:hypothetical protein
VRSGRGGGAAEQPQRDADDGDDQAEAHGHGRDGEAEDVEQGGPQDTADLADRVLAVELTVGLASADFEWGAISRRELALQICGGGGCLTAVLT